MLDVLFRWWDEGLTWLKRVRGRRIVVPRAGARPAIEQLEERLVMSQNVFLPQQINPSGGPNQQPTQQLQIFQPSSIAVIPQPGLASGQLTLSGSFTLTDTGSFKVILQQSGPTSAGTATLSESGTVTFSLVFSGSVSATGFTVRNLTLAEIAVLSWGLVQTDASGVTLSNQTGSQNLTTTTSATATGTAGLDPFLAVGLNWLAPSRQLLQDNALNPGTLSLTSLSIGETGQESYTFQVLNGLETYHGQGGLAVPSPLQSSTAQTSLTLTGGFTYLNQGQDTFALNELGATGTTGQLALSSAVYDETGKQGPGAPGTLSLGAQTQFSLSGTVTQGGLVQQISQQTFPGLNLTLPSSIAQLSSGAGQTPLSSSSTPQNDAETFRFSQNLPYNYSESGSQGFALREAGSFGTGGFSLNSVTASSSGQGTYSLTNLQGQQNASGTFSDSQDGSLFTNGANLLAQVSSSSAGSFSLNAQIKQSQSGAGTFQNSLRRR